MSELSLEQMAVALIVLFPGLPITILMGFCLKTVLISVLRWAGLCSPKLYYALPRLPWRMLWRVFLSIDRWIDRVVRDKKQVTGNFAGLLETLCLPFTGNDNNVLLGRAYGAGLPLIPPVGIKYQRHLFAVAMSGAGKSVFLTTFLALFNGSAFVIDPKGQISQALYKADRRTWRVFDPYDLCADIASVSFNVFDVIKARVEEQGQDIAVYWADKIAQALIATPEDSKNGYFYDTARSFLKGVILHVLSAHEQEHQNLPYVRDLITQGYAVDRPEEYEGANLAEVSQALLLQAMSDNPAFGSVVKGSVAALHSASGETAGNVLSTLFELTQWLDNPLIRKYLYHSDINLAELKTRDDWVLSFVAPVLSLKNELAPLARLLTNMTAYLFEVTVEKKGQCLLLVDEFPSLGHNAIFEFLLPVARGYGITFFGITQDLELLKKSYPKSWEGFLGNSDVTLWMASNHQLTLEYLSKCLGRRRIHEYDYSTHKHISRDIDVASPEQVRRFLNSDSGRMIATRAGARPLRLVNEPHYKALPVWSYFPDRDHREPILRRITRRIFGKAR